MGAELVAIEGFARGHGSKQGGDGQQGENRGPLPRGPALGPTEEEGLGEHVSVD